MARLVFVFVFLAQSLGPIQATPIEQIAPRANPIDPYRTDRA